MRLPPFSRGTWSWAVQSSSSTLHRYQMVLGTGGCHLALALVWHCRWSGDRTRCQHPKLPWEEPAAAWALSHRVPELGSITSEPRGWQGLFDTYRATGCACKCRFETGRFAHFSSIQSLEHRGTFIHNNSQKFFLTVFTFHKS